MPTNTSTFDKVVEQTRVKYENLMLSDNISKLVRINGIETRGQVEDNRRQSSTKEEQTKTVATLLDVKVSRGDYIEIKSEAEEEDYNLQGLVSSIPNKTPVDYYYSVLLFNTIATRHRKNLEYDEDGYIIADSPSIEENIGCFVQRIGQRQRQVDVGIDRDSVNEIITLKSWDIKKNDVLYIGSDRYKITDIEELDKDMFIGYMTYYRV